MTIPQPIEIALFFLLLAGLVVSRFLNVGTFGFLAAFLIPFLTPRLSMGVGIDWYKIVGPLTLVLFIGRRSAASTAAKEMRWFVLYCVLGSVIWMVLEYTTLQRYRLAEAFGLEATTSYYKMPVQIVSFVGQLTTVFMVPIVANRVEDASRVLRGFAAGCMTSILIGLMLLAVTGDGTVNFSVGVQVSAGGVQLSRLGGVSGEPKTLGAVLVILTLFEICIGVFSSRGIGRRGWGLVSAGLIALAITFSTSAWIGFAAAIAAAVPFAVFLGRWRPLVALVGALGVVVMLVMVNPLGKSIYETRFENRLFGGTSELGKQKDMFVLQAFNDSPQDVVWGYGLGGADLAVIRYIPPSERYYRRSPTPGATGARLLGDVGIVGLLVLGAVVVAWSRRLFRMGDPAAGVFVMIGIVAIMFMPLISLTAYLLIVGAVLARATLRAAANGPSSEPGVVRTPALGGLG